MVATPIGNLGDITYRAVETLNSVSVIAAEDTRHTKRLLQKYAINTPLTSFHQHTDPHKITALLERGETVALVSDAGTPGISDPGAKLIALCRQHNLTVVPIPGPAALIVALCASGLPLDEFTFHGFIPQKKGRQTFYRGLAESDITSVFYESSHRILKCVTEMTIAIPERIVVLARELTKIHEEFLSGTPQEILSVIEQYPEKTKGEFVVLVAGKKFKHA